MTSTTALPDDIGRRFITGAREILGSAADALGDLDRRAGDGDFGTNVRTAMRNLDRTLEAEEPATYRAWVTAMSMAWLGVGGTSGPLLGMFFRDLAKAGADGSESSETVPTLEQVAEALAAGQAVVQKYGEAEVGDKTMIDSLAPAIDALRGALPAGNGAAAGKDAAAGTDAAATLADAEQAAVEAARATAETVARRGRASYVGDVAKGVIDPGAAAMALVLGALRAAVDGEAVDTAWIE